MVGSKTEENFDVEEEHTDSSKYGPEDHDERTAVDDSDSEFGDGSVGVPCKNRDAHFPIITETDVSVG